MFKNSVIWIYLKIKNWELKINKWLDKNVEIKIPLFLIHNSSFSSI